MPEYPHRVTVALTDNMFRAMKQDMGLRHQFCDLQHDDTTVFVLHFLKAIEENKTDTIYLRSLKEAYQAGRSKQHAKDQPKGPTRGKIDTQQS